MITMQRLRATLASIQDCRVQALPFGKAIRFPEIGEEPFFIYWRTWS
jgi:hypothetical protein